METTTYLLFVLGCLGAADILLFHSVAHSIRSHPDSVQELVTHSFRGPTYAVLFILVPNFVLHGLFAWALLLLLVCDVGISVWDFSLEKASRRFLGGLPSGEYVLHMLMAMVFGGFATSFIMSTGRQFQSGTEIVYSAAAVPVAVRALMVIMAALVIFSGMQDALAALRLRRSCKRSVQPAGNEPCGSPQAAEQLQGAHPVEWQLSPPWMRWTLTAAGIYNLAWGAWVILFPAALFRLTHSALPNYLQIWQCVGMIVGVYGVGYLIAARNPFRHWPIILVGLLGKVFGPIGMAYSLWTGALPRTMSWVCVTNDLLWWFPFFLILWSTWERHSVGAVHPKAQG